MRFLLEKSEDASVLEREEGLVGAKYERRNGIWRGKINEGDLSWVIPVLTKGFVFQKCPLFEKFMDWRG